MTKNISLSIVSPIQKLLQGTKEIINGNLNYKVDLNRQDELGEFARAFNLMTTRVKEYRKKLQEHTKKLEETVNKRTIELNKQLEKSEKQRIANLVVLKDLNKTTQNLKKEIAERKKAELELTRINRLYRILSSINQAIVHIRNKQTIFDETCRIVVNDGKFRMAWIGLIDEKQNKVVPVASAGLKGDYLDTINIDLNDAVLSNGPSGRAVKSGTYCVFNEILKKPEMAPWKEKAAKYGYQSSAAFPIKVSGKIIGTLNLYSEEPFFFDDIEIKLLDKLTQDISFAIDFINSETERKISEQNLRKLSTAVTQSPSVIVITDTQGDIEYVNPKFEKLTGYSREEVIGKNPRILKSGEQPYKMYKELWDTITSGKDWRGEFHNKKKNGELFWEAASISPIYNEQGKIINFIKVAEDITEKKKMIEELIKAKDKAQESDRLKSAFLANMSHEIRTPMNGILGFTALLEEENLSTEVRKEYIDAIQKSGDRMLNTINAIMDISKIEAGMVEVSSHEVNINHNIEDLYKFFGPEIKEKGIQFSYKTALSTNDSIILSDGNKVYAILTNLIKNAIKFTNQGTIEFGYVKKDKQLEFYVKDTGMGIPKERHQAIFDRFVQADIEDRMAIQGNGLGLSIVKAYVEMLGGKIWLEYSEPGKGSEFRFTLPYKPVYTIPDENKPEIKKDENEGSKKTTSKGLKILVAEDDEESVHYLSIILKDIAETVLFAGNGKQTIEILKNNPDIDLILMDMMMPVMNGYQATRQIRTFNKDIVIIAQTANALSGDKEKVLAAGCNDYITKPLSINALKKVISRYFKAVF